MEILKDTYFRTFKTNSDKDVVDLFWAQILESYNLIKRYLENAKFMVFVYSKDSVPVNILQSKFEET